ncbi:GNAT family N-acetyltransferase [Burkholderia sp. Bp9017]|uniref:GNAT family N-acetyltransferase n=1 Tax=Burkholderia anthina TaxID=179879 RepID=A0A7T6VLG4_9BURK|nr:MULTISPECIES: GNAT family N-acetyltransferase [Burkholderia]MBY4871377.1 GNAT family N-acetyltransferase [Burkholderia anthina]QQK06081.1 GNAT family N-acetyltransferase [Burkholderia anthina]RQZ15755.1 GNAT family N-acetyltransferase [Burkholderia sp. Bp9017]RQZ26743.1 GNAT family N-acetyltransferase [Burkholderia sp. Bp9016]
MTARPDVSFQLTDTEQPAARDFISSKLGEFNHAMTGRSDTAALDVYVTDPATGEILGGLTGRTSLGLFFIDLFYLPESLRGGGFGSRLLGEAEAEAKRRGCARAVLYTITFQAPDFYRKHGYEAFGEVPCEPEGTARVFMVKTL